MVYGPSAMAATRVTALFTTLGSVPDHQASFNVQSIFDPADF